MKEHKITEYTLLPGAELESLVREEADTAALEELMRREAVSDETIDAAWQQFTTHYLPIEGKDSIYAEEAEAPKVRHFRLYRSLGAAAIAAVVACMLVVQAGGTKGLATMARWTVDRFFFSDTLIPDRGNQELKTQTGDDAASSAASQAAPGAAWGDESEVGVYTVEDAELKSVSYSSLAEAVAAFGGETLLPTAIPEGYSFESASITESCGWQQMIVYYTNAAEDLLQFHYDRIGEDTVMSTIVEKDDQEVERYEREGTSYYILSNGKYASVNWKPDEWTECRISGPVTREELRALVDSMYE